MKKIILLLLVLTITTTALFTQNSLNPKKIDGFNFSSTFLDRDYNKHKFLRGWNWGNTDTLTHKLDNQLNINSFHHYILKTCTAKKKSS